VIAKDARHELVRIHFRQDGVLRTLIVNRVPADQALETQLLPLLARKTDSVPGVRSRGIPPPAAGGWPWLLIEDVVDAPSACEADAREIVRAKAVLERAVAADGPALRALGVPALGPGELVDRSARTPRDAALRAEARAAAVALEGLPVVLAHGDLT